jgi:predicted TIM-barrel fold metal-dependent hydrolase
MKLPEQAPVGIVDPLVQLTLGVERIPLPRQALRDEFSLQRWPSRAITGYLFTQAYAQTEEARERRAEDEKIAADIELWMQMLDRNGISMAGCTLSASDPDALFEQIEARAARVFATVSVDPHSAMDGVRRLAEIASRYKCVRGVSLSPFGTYPFIAPNSKEYYPIYAKCVELGLAVFINVGVPGPRVPAWVQDPQHLDEVCWFFPDLTVVMRHGGAPWEELCVKMLLRWPNLYYATTAMTPRFYPEAITRYLRTRGADKILFAGYWPNIPYAKVFAELSELDLKPATWSKFLGVNARRAFGLPCESTASA